ncbi:MAG TPA: sugar phosphate isomerase/epimerase family protein [Pirellulales bacterium]|nr:sugar phosphate isomerase/epimerase family protein [Pirellulales bacterium]
MPKPKIGIQLASLKMPLRQALTIAQRLGADGVEIDARSGLSAAELSQTGIRQIRKLLDDLNLKVTALAYPTRRGYDVPDEIERRVAGTKSAMKLARDLGTDVVINDVGRIPAESEGPQWQLLLDVLTDLGRHGLHVGARLAADTGSVSGPELLRLLQALPPASIGVNFNPGQLIVNGHSALETAETVGAEIVHVHAQDGVRDLARGRGIEVELGRGSVDFPNLLGLLEEREYRGYLTVLRHHASDPVGELRLAIEYLHNL